MNKKIFSVKGYSAPSLTMTGVAVEKGFAQSGKWDDASKGSPDFGFGSDIDDIFG